MSDVRHKASSYRPVPGYYLRGRVGEKVRFFNALHDTWSRSRSKHARFPNLAAAADELTRISEEGLNPEGFHIDFVNYTRSPTRISRSFPPTSAPRERL